MAGALCNTERWIEGCRIVRNIGSVENGESIRSALHVSVFPVVSELFVQDSDRILFLHERTNTKLKMLVRRNGPQQGGTQRRANHSSFCLLVFLLVKHIKMMQFSSIRLRQNPLEDERRTLVATIMSYN